MLNITNKMLTCMASAAEEAFIEALGCASFGGAYEPEMPEAAKQYKAEHTSRTEKIFDKV